MKQDRPEASRPNILWICTDQQRWDTLGSYGNTFVHTPNLDRLADSGVLFEEAYCQSPVCAPSRGSFLTSRYPRTTRLRQNGQDIPEDEVLVTRLLAEAGYACGLSGKLHLSACDPTVCPTTERRINDGYAEFYWSHDPMDAWPCHAYRHWVREQGAQVPVGNTDLSSYVRKGFAAEHHQTTWCVDRAITFLQDCGRFNRSWLFSVNIFDPHHGFDPPADYLARYLDRLDEIPLPNYISGELDDKPQFQRIDHHGAYNNPDLFPYAKMTDHDHRAIRAAYWAMVDLIDAQVGRLLQALEDSGQRENTIVIFMSDHGELLGDHGIYLKGPHFYDCSVRIPLIISWPGTIPSGRRSKALVELVDLAPTLLDATGLHRYPGMQGLSLWPLLTGRSELDSLREDVYCEYYNANLPHSPKAYATMVRTREWKLAAVHGLDDQGELYDLQGDPSEVHNLWHDAEHVDMRVAMLKRLVDRMAFTADPLPIRRSSW